MTGDGLDLFARAVQVDPLCALASSRSCPFSMQTISWEVAAMAASWVSGLQRV